MNLTTYSLCKKSGGYAIIVRGVVIGEVYREPHELRGSAWRAMARGPHGLKFAASWTRDRAVADVLSQAFEVSA